MPQSLNSSQEAPAWAPAVLRCAAIYNLLWGALTILFPEWTLGWLLDAERLLALDPLTFVFWQCIGMIVGVYGVGYWVAAADPLRHWPIVLVGFLGKIFGPIGFLQGLWLETVPLRFGWTILANDLLWWIPFGLILWHARSAAVSPDRR
ncbi:MAG: hypothetical protein CBC13_04600 [Planctomycetia bacterium TMED53]|nr:MAG: hypothetical protein CBC13_04600 [Planctomycetia bacterium TMED53]